MPGLAPCHRPATTFRKKGSSFVLGSPQFGRWMTTDVINGTGAWFGFFQCEGLPTKIYDVNDPTTLAQTVRLGTVPDPNTVLEVTLTQFLL